MLVQFENDAEATVFVAAQHVTHIVPIGGDGGRSMIYFVGGSSITIKQTRDEVVNRLRQALAIKD